MMLVVDLDDQLCGEEGDAREAEADGMLPPESDARARAIAKQRSSSAASPTRVRK